MKLLTIIKKTGRESQKSKTLKVANQIIYREIKWFDYKKETVGYGDLKDTDEMNKIDELLAKLIKKKEIDLLPISGLKEAILVQILQTLRGFPDSSVGKESACNAGDPSSIPGLGRSIFLDLTK